MLLKRSYLALDMTSKNVFKIKSKCRTRRVSRQLASCRESWVPLEMLFCPCKSFSCLRSPQPQGLPSTRPFLGHH